MTDPDPYAGVPRPDRDLAILVPIIAFAVFVSAVVAVVWLWHLI